MTRTTRTLTLAAVGALLLAACGTDADPATSAPPTTAPATTADAATTTAPLVPLSTAAPSGVPPSDYGGFRTQPTACGAARPPENAAEGYMAANDMLLDPSVRIRATITTSCGPIVVELDPAMAPETVNSFVFLAMEGYFDGSVSHRVLPGFVIQAGDPTGTGMGNPGYVVPDELPAPGFEYSTGVLAMANAGPNSTGSQFFIMLGDSGLPPQYSAFGIVVEGLDTMAAIADVPLGISGRGEPSVPLETVYIESVTIDGID
jgi:cyclophilin family peptidyl-prolyl cis-trans isomerase